MMFDSSVRPKSVTSSVQGFVIEETPTFRVDILNCVSAASSARMLETAITRNAALPRTILLNGYLSNRLSVSNRVSTEL